MMQQLKLYDPARKPTEWTGMVHDGQYAVFHSDMATDIERTPEGNCLQPGEDSTCLVFDSLVEAESYCESKVAQIPHLRCDIYDHTGKSKAANADLCKSNSPQHAGKTRLVELGPDCCKPAMLLDCMGSSRHECHILGCWAQSTLRRPATHLLGQRWNGEAPCS